MITAVCLRRLELSISLVIHYDVYVNNASSYNFMNVDAMQTARKQQSTETAVIPYSL